ncbi:replicative DNA helicase [Miniphocaeibacter massiliensis]|uniref:replicative DNA helicase n=1 Tax=Miniphocaeibacter massiliensis TaxID=2041841 RepID=UPI000C07C271|nr:replicative DNA helicase [Miniphocaeibacter massiliensis]
MEELSTGRVFPNDISAEMSVLGSMILDKNAIDVATGILKYEDFYTNKNAEVYKSIVNLTDKGEAIDFVTISEELKKEGKLDFVGGMQYLMELTEFVPGPTNIESYSKIVKEKATLRNLIRISDEIMSRSYANSPAEEVLEFAESSIYSISQSKNKGDLEKISSILEETLDQINQMSLNEGGLTGITTGLVDLNKQISGFQKSDLVLLAARPSMGKTTLALNMALSAALDHKNIAVFSLEMSKLQLSQRFLSSLSLINLQDIISGNIAEGDFEMLGNAIRILEETPIYVDDTSSISLTELRSKCRRLSSKEGLDLVLIDYIQLMTAGTGRNENRQQEISTISRGLKGLAKELNCPVVALSQLSRAVESRTDKRPMLSDLRESGAIEQDADIVMMIYRDDYYNPESEKPNIADLIIAKHRNGPTGTVELYFNKQYSKFTDLVSDFDSAAYGE